MSTVPDFDFLARELISDFCVSLHPAYANFFPARRRIYFLHFARKTFNPWAGLKTDSRSAAGRWTARSVPDWPPGHRQRWPSAKTGGRGILSRGLRRAAQTVLQRGGRDDGHVHQFQIFVGVEVTRLISISGWRLRIADFSIRASSRRLLRFNVRRRVAREHPGQPAPRPAVSRVHATRD